MITEEKFNEAQEIVKLFNLQKEREIQRRFIPEIEKDMIMEYRDSMGKWYEYNESLQSNIYFIPKKLRVRKR